ncbi:MAG: RNA polymerase sigma-70 factor [Muribaculaceae bacterium]
MLNFEDFYVMWYSRAKRFAYEYVMSENDAEDIVQDIFLKLYERRELFDVYANPTAYLLTSIKNRCIDRLRQVIDERQLVENINDVRILEKRLSLDVLESFDVNFPDEESIEKRLKQALDALPERCRTIFVMNKIEGKKQSQIAEELGLSINTIESQMAIAYAKLRVNLKDCLPLLLFFFLVD